MPKIPKHTLGDAPIVPEHHKQMNDLARNIDGVINGKGPRKIGFVLLVFPYGETDGRRCNFISNGADRGDLTVLFREMAARFEEQAETAGNA
jgi:hypothetical protein